MELLSEGERDIAHITQVKISQSAGRGGNGEMAGG